MSTVLSAVADAAERAAALDPQRSFIVQAPAGSGKTELLTQRLLVLLSAVEEPEEAVAMTFTRKAAAEMRHRVFSAVRRALDDTPPQDPHKQRTWSLARAVLQRSRTRGWRLQDNPQRLRVLTIDSLCAQIVQQSPLTAGVGGRIQITEFAEPLYRRAARATLASLEQDLPQAAAVARVLRHFDNRTAVLEQQLIGLLARREQWLPLATHRGREQRPREVLEATLNWIVRDALSRAQAAVPEALHAIWLESARHASSQLYAGAPELPVHLLRDGRWPSAEPGDLPRWHALLGLVFTQGEARGWRSKIDARLGFPAGKTKAERAELGPARDAHLQLIARLAALPGAREVLLALYQLPAPQYDDAQWEVLQALLDTLRLAAAHLRVVFAARGEVDFAEVAAQAAVALGEGGDEDENGGGAPSELALRLDYRIRHLLVDEFQDTSSTQWELLLRLTAGWTPGDGRSLFVVGDPMQSIYRFREADVGLFLRAWRDGIGALPLEPLRLRCNFRSRAGIVDWVNEAFAQVLPAAADLNRSAVPYSPAVATHAADAEPAVRVHTAVDEGSQAEALRVRELVAHAQHRDPQGSVAILVRSRGHLVEIARVLREAGIAYRAVDIESLAERPVITDLRALTWALLHPQDRTAWLAVLRAPWCALALADLYALCGDLPRERSLLLALRDPLRRQGMSPDGQHRLQPVLRVLEAALATQGRRPLRRWIESTWLALGGPACAQGASALADAAVFFDCLQQVAPGAMLDDFAQLDLALAQLKALPDPAADERVSVMTIHKSKGLEFDTVIVPGLGRGTRSDEQPLIAWAQLTDVDGEDRLVLAPVHATGDERDPSFDYVRSLEAEKQRFEDGRLLYVAATRARRCLHLLGSIGRSVEGQAVHPPGRSLLARLWPAVSAYFLQLDGDGEAAARPDEHREPVAAAEERLTPPLRRRVGWAAPQFRSTLPLPAPAVGERGEVLRFDWAGESARCVGIVFHRWVQFIAEDGVEQWPAARCEEMLGGVAEDLRREGVPQPQLPAATARVLAGLRNTLGDDRGRWLLRADHADVYSELALSVIERGHARRLVLDRSFVDARGTRWIVDFKTSSHEGGDVAEFVRRELDRYRPQLLAYTDALTRLYPGSEGTVRAALYLPLIDDPALRWAELQ